METGKTYLLIGGSHGIGRALTQKLATHGHRVIVLSRTAADLPTIPLVSHFPYDVLQDTFPTEALPAALDGLVYLPGSINLRGFASIKPEQFREEMEINCIGAVRCIQAALKALKQGSGSSIVLFSTSRSLAAGHPGFRPRSSFAAAASRSRSTKRSPNSAA